MWFASLRRSSTGSLARFAISTASSVSRSVVVTKFFSREGIKCVYPFVGKSGKMWRRSVMSRWKGVRVGHTFDATRARIL